MPYFMPESFDKDFCKYFTGTYNNLIKVSHTLLFYSEQTKQDLCTFFPKVKFDSKLKKIRLGADINISESDVVSYDLQQNFTNKEYIIYVSSIAPRKNHHLLVYVWLLLLEKYGVDCPYLVLVGNSTKNEILVQNTLDLIYRNPGLKHKIIFMSGVNNKTLKWLYENALFSVFPSFTKAGACLFLNL